MTCDKYLGVNFFYAHFGFRIFWSQNINFDEFGLKKDKFANSYIKYCNPDIQEIYSIIERLRQSEYQPGSQKYLESERKIRELST